MDKIMNRRGFFAKLMGAAGLGTALGISNGATNGSIDWLSDIQREVGELRREVDLLKSKQALHIMAPHSPSIYTPDYPVGTIWHDTSIPSPYETWYWNGVGWTIVGYFDV
jgi:hypothetical protein